MAKSIMIQGTASSAGKSLITTGLCRIFRQDGRRAAPFKSQNMALNSFITAAGREMGRAQAVQAEAAGVEASERMNPILLKPTGDAVSRVIVNGLAVADMTAAEYRRRKAEFLPDVRRAFAALAAEHEIIVIEGAGSPAEINLRDGDFVNMGMAAIAGAPVLLVGDIDRGGVFASLHGTVALLEPDERARLRGLIVNKFRGDAEILRPGLERIEELTGIPVVGVVPWLAVEIDEEDGAGGRLDGRRGERPIDVAAIRWPRIANFTDIAPLARHPALGVRYVGAARRLGRPDFVVLPDSQNAMADLAWARENGLEAAIRELAAAGVPVMGLGGGYQMLGAKLKNQAGHELRGIELLPVDTVADGDTARARAGGRVEEIDGGFFSCLSGTVFDAYAIQSGRSTPAAGTPRFAALSGDGGPVPDGAVRENVMGTSARGLFDSGEIPARLAARLLAAKGLPAEAANLGEQRAFREGQYDLLAAALRESLDMKAIYAMLDMPGI